MKKLSFLGIAAMCMLASCSNDAVISAPEVPQTAIGFEGAFVNKSTRAIAQNELGQAIYNSGFTVYGVLYNPSSTTGDNVGTVFDGNQDVTYNNSALKWEYTNIRYWIIDNEYTFSAIAPGVKSSTYSNASWTVSGITTGLDQTSMKKPNGIINLPSTNGNVDLGYAFNHVGQATASMAPVAFTFNHLLSKVSLKFTNAFQSSSSKLVISDVKLVSANAGKYDLSKTYVSDENPCDIHNTYWYDITGSAEYAYTFGSDNKASSQIDNTASVSPTNWFYILPSQTSIRVDFSVTLYVDGVETGTWPHSVDVDLIDHNITDTPQEVNPAKFVLKPGYAYELIAKINRDNVANEALNPIEFTVNTTPDWETPSYEGNGGTLNTQEIGLILLGLNESGDNQIKVGDTLTISPNVTIGNYTSPNDYSVTYEYSSSDTNAATIADNVITGVAVGETNITVTANVTFTKGQKFSRTRTFKVSVVAAD